MSKRAIILAVFTLISINSVASATNLSAFGFKGMRRTTKAKAMQIRGKGFGTFDTPTIFIRPLSPNTVIFPRRAPSPLNAVDIQNIFNGVNLGSL